MSFEIPDPVRVLMDDEPLLRTTSRAIEPDEFGDDLDSLFIAMARVVYARQARGLAAVQLGVPVRVLIVREGPLDLRAEPQFQPFVNPTLDRTLNRFTVEREGCLSILPSKWGDVSRPAKCDVSWFDLRGGNHSATLTGDTARIFQHEFDHLNGVLLTDHRLAA